MAFPWKHAAMQDPAPRVETSAKREESKPLGTQALLCVPQLIFGKLLVYIYMHGYIDSIDFYF